jgi:hypothetical protein
VHSASVGVGLGVFIGILKIVYDIYLFYLILPIYGITCVLTYFSSNAIAHIAWDAGAITTGPVTVPLVMGIGYAFLIIVIIQCLVYLYKSFSFFIIFSVGVSVYAFSMQRSHF